MTVKIPPSISPHSGREFTEYVMLLPTRDFETGSIDGAELRVPITTPGDVVFELMRVLGLEADDEYDEDGWLVITAVPSRATISPPLPPAA